MLSVEALLPLLVLVLAGFLLARFRPSWMLPLLVVVIPFRMPLDAAWNPALPLFFGMLAGRWRALLELARTEAALLAVMAVWPAWILVSASWALQPAFVAGLLGKWLVVFLAFVLAATDDLRAPRLLVAGLLLAVVPHALWAFGERMHWIGLIGDFASLEMRGINFQGAVRGKALFWHPNRLAEFTEQAGVLLAGMAAGGILPLFASAGVAAAMLAAWSTGSTAGMAVIFGGTILCVGWTLMSGTARRRAILILTLAGLGAAVAGIWAFISHGGIGSRQIIFDFAAREFAERPWLGAGAGNWSLLVGQAEHGVSRFWFRGHAHSLPLHIAVELGLVGVACAAVFFAAPLVVAWRRFAGLLPVPRAVGTGASFAVLGILAHNLVHYFLRDPTDGIMTGLVLGWVWAAARTGRQTIAEASG